jgi:hypothetical protein
MIQIAIRNYFSLQQLAAACELAKLCEDTEKKLSDTSKWPSSNRLVQASAIGALISSVAFMEATINEVFADCADGTSPHHQPFPNSALLADLWSRGVPRRASYNVLDKYQIALNLSGRENMKEDEKPFQDASALVFARNYLIHYEPEWVRSTTPPEKPKLQKIHSRLKGKFDLNTLAPSGSFFFPDKALGAGCARWSVSTALALVDEFFERAGVRATYDHVRSEPPYNYHQRT